MVLTPLQPQQTFINTNYQPNNNHSPTGFKIALNMKTLEIGKEVIIEINHTHIMPITIEAAGNYINISFEELELIYKFAKQELSK